MGKSTVVMIQTTELNEAAYLYTLGIVPIYIRRISQVQSIFSYKKSKEINEILLHYRTGMAEGSLSHFMFTRDVLKRMVAARVIDKLDDNSPAVGDYYWYIINNTVLGAHYGNKESVHYERWSQGNFYKTKQEALSSLNV